MSKGGVIDVLDVTVTWFYIHPPEGNKLINKGKFRPNICPFTGSLPTATQVN